MHSNQLVQIRHNFETDCFDPGKGFHEIVRWNTVGFCADSDTLKHFEPPHQVIRNLITFHGTVSVPEPILKYIISA